MPEELLTLEILQTRAVQIAIVYAIVAISKESLDKYFPANHTALYAWVLGGIINTLVALGLGADPFNWVIYFIGAMNGVWITIGSGGVDAVAKKLSAVAPKTITIEAVEAGMTDGQNRN